jgi:hypothetical protein
MAMVRFTTRELSMRTFADFERFFAQVHGCACTLYLFGRHLSPLAGTAEQRAQVLGSQPDRSRKHFPHKEAMRARELAAVKGLVRRGQAHGILVYADREPVGWCHFGRADELPVESEESAPNTTYARHRSTDWVITCFTTRMDFRRQGVAGRALKAAVAAIKKQGGGWVEAVPIAFPHNDPTVRKLRREFGWGSPELTSYVAENWPTHDLPGIGRVNGCLTTKQTMAHMGTMSMFEKAGFTAAGIDEIRSSDDPRYPPSDFVVMRLKV